LAIRYFGFEVFIGTKLHFNPVKNPAPPLPLRFDSFTRDCISCGVIPFNAFLTA
jgi:hypothetical protein